MDILAQEKLLLNAQTKFNALKQRIREDSQERVRIDRTERNTFSELLSIGLMLLEAFVAGAGVGDEGGQVTRGGRIQRSDTLRRKLYRSVFGTLSILRWVYARGAKKKIEYAPTDARLGRVTDPWGARAAVMIGDIWQWTPFMFIVLLAAIEGQSVELVEAARVDGANRWQAFWSVTFPQILPVSTTLILIRMIEAFKIIDLPNVLTNGGPGTATESLSLQAFIAWRSLDLGTSAAIAYTLLLLVTFISMSYINLIRRRVTGEL